MISCDVALGVDRLDRIFPTPFLIESDVVVHIHARKSPWGTPSMLNSSTPPEVYIGDLVTT